MMNLADLTNDTVINDDNIKAIVGLYLNNKSSLPRNFKTMNDWNVSQVTNMSGLFSNKPRFNEYIGEWNVSNVRNMSEMFYNASMFNQNIGNWNTQNVENMSKMFANTREFNQYIGDWNVSQVKNMSSMFESALNFNNGVRYRHEGSMSLNWHLTSLINANSMFKMASKFNGELNFTGTSNNEIDVTMMLYGATSFGHELNHLRIRTTPEKSRWVLKNVRQFNDRLNEWEINVKRPGITNIDNDEKFQIYINFYGAETEFEIDKLRDTKAMGYVPRIVLNMPDPEPEPHTFEIFQLFEHDDLSGTQIQGNAYIPHNAFNQYEAEELNNVVRLLSQFLNTQINVSNYQSLTKQLFWNEIFDRIEISIRNNPELNQASRLQGIRLIKQRVMNYEDISYKLKIIVDLSIKYALNQSPEFITQYLNSFTQDCIQAYGDSRSFSEQNYNPSQANVSCPKGIYEKIVLLLHQVLTQICLMGGECTDEYKELLQAFGFINMSEFTVIMNTSIQMWSQNHLENDDYIRENGWSENNSIEEIKEDFISYITELCINGLKEKTNVETNELPSKFIRKINETANVFERDGIFGRMYFGGRRIRQIKNYKNYKKYTNKRKYIKTHKKKYIKNKNGQNKNKTTKYKYKSKSYKKSKRYHQ